MKDIEREGVEACRHAQVTIAFGTWPQNSCQGAEETLQMRKMSVTGALLLLNVAKVGERNESEEVIERECKFCEIKRSSLKRDHYLVNMFIELSRE